MVLLHNRVPTLITDVHLPSLSTTKEKLVARRTFIPLFLIENPGKYTSGYTRTPLTWERVDHS